MKPNTLDGVKMLHHDEMRNYDRIQGKIISVIMNHGCKIVETPSFEDYDVYQHFFPHLRRQMVKTVDTDGRVLVLRPDVTLPLVESAAREFPRPNQLLKFGYVSTVFREYFGRSTYGKDFLQGGIEILGDPSPSATARSSSWPRKSSRPSASKTSASTSAPQRIRRPCSTPCPCRKRRRTGCGLSGRPQSRRPAPLSERLVPAGNARCALEALPVLFGPYAQTLGKAKDYCLNSGMLNALARLEKIYDYILYAGFADKVQLDFGFASRLGYYTDMVFKVYVDGALYDVIDGGRYDTLSAQFGIDRPACGFGMNINLLYEFMNDAGLLAQAEPSFQLAVSYAASDQVMVRDLMRWRSQGFRVAATPSRPLSTAAITASTPYTAAARITRTAGP